MMQSFIVRNTPVIVEPYSMLHASIIHEITQREIGREQLEEESGRLVTEQIS